MANSDIASGLRPVSKLDGSPLNGAARAGYWAGDTSTTIYVGDPVKLTGTADDNGTPAFARANAGDAFWGVCTGILGDSNEDLTRDTARYLSTTAGYLSVLKADNIIFEIQEDSASATLAKTSVGLKFDLVFGTPNTSHPIKSACELDSDSATTGAAQVQVIGFPRRPDNVIGDNAKWLVVAAEIQTAGL